MVLVRDRRAEEGHEPVAQELVHGALEAVDLGEHQLERAVDERVHVLGIERFRDGREAGGIGEEHADLLALARERGAVLQDALGEMRGGVSSRRLEPLGSAGGRRGGGGGQRCATLAAELLARRDRSAALATDGFELGAALLAVPSTGTVLGSTRGASHREDSTRASDAARGRSSMGGVGVLWQYGSPSE